MDPNPAQQKIKFKFGVCDNKVTWIKRTKDEEKKASKSADNQTARKAS